MCETPIDVWQFILIIDLAFGYLVAIQYLNSDLRLSCQECIRVKE
jgi:hypothetical protein